MDSPTALANMRFSQAKAHIGDVTLRHLEAAIEAQNYALLSYLIQQKPHLAPDACSYAILAGDITATVLLCQSMTPSQIEQKTKSHYHDILSQKGSDPEMARFLFDMSPNIDLNVGVGFDPPAIYLANTVGMVEMLVGHFGVDINLTKGVSRTPICDALGCLLGKVEGDWEGVVSTLLKLGADPRLVGSDETTPLQVAVEYANRKWIDRLLGLRVSPLTKNSAGSNLLHALVSFSDIDTLEDIPARIEIAKLLIELGVSPSELDGQSQTPLLAACRYSDYGTLPLIKIFYQNKPDTLYIPDSDGSLPLMRFVENGPIPDELIQFLRLGSQDMAREDELGKTALDYAFGYYREMVHEQEDDEGYQEQIETATQNVKILWAFGARESETSLPQELIPSEEEILDIRYQIYFARSLVSQTLSPSVVGRSLAGQLRYL